jgi:hypothetical protein
MRIHRQTLCSISLINPRILLRSAEFYLYMYEIVFHSFVLYEFFSLIIVKGTSRESVIVDRYDAIVTYC